MTGEPIDLAAVKEAIRDRRVSAEIDANDKQWWAFYEQLLQLMATSGLHQTSLTAAVLAALLDILTIKDAELDDIKSDVVRSLACFH
jgi:hypothetical protein